MEILSALKLYALPVAPSSFERAFISVGETFDYVDEHKIKDTSYEADLFFFLLGYYRWMYYYDAKPHYEIALALLRNKFKIAGLPGVNRIFTMEENRYPATGDHLYRVLVAIEDMHTLPLQTRYRYLLFFLFSMAGRENMPMKFTSKKQSLTVMKQCPMGAYFDMVLSHLTYSKTPAHKNEVLPNIVTHVYRAEKERLSHVPAGVAPRADMMELLRHLP